jgi:uncharacterized RDD family membrane protein YckC
MSSTDPPRPPAAARTPETADAGAAEGERRRRGIIGSVIGRVAPTVIDNIDMDDVIEAVDVNQIAERLDLNALVDRMDVDAVAARLDLNALVDRMDIDAIAARLDLDALVDRMDIDAVAARLDLNALIERIDMTQLTAGASQEFAQSGLDLARRQVIRADGTVDAFVDRTLLRRRDRRPDAPPWLRTTPPLGSGAEPEPEPEADPDAPGRDAPGRRNVSGHYAGPVSRVLTTALDFAASFTVYGFLASAVTYLLDTFTPADVAVSAPGIVAAVLGGAWLVLWLAVPVALFGRTPAMALVGLAVLGRTGDVVATGRAFVRALVEPLAAALLLVGFAGVFVGRERRALHDVAAGTIVVYDWGVREAQRPTTVRGFLSARVRRVDPRADADG